MSKHFEHRHYRARIEGEIRGQTGHPSIKPLSEEQIAADEHCLLEYELGLVEGSLHALRDLLGVAERHDVLPSALGDLIELIYDKAQDAAGRALEISAGRR